MTSYNIGLLGLQGAIEEHEQAIVNAARKMDLEINMRRVLEPSNLEGLHGIIMPGGESTAMIKQGTRSGILPELRRRLQEGFPAFGTCAGAILLSQRVKRDENSPVKEGAFPTLDLTILRNGYGTQRESFSTEMEIAEENKRIPGVFIRAPVIEEVGNVDVFANVRGTPVFVGQDNVMATTFHPELTSSTYIHEMFLSKVVAFNE